jgi:hypothetical protein
MISQRVLVLRTANDEVMTTMTRGTQHAGFNMSLL